MAALQIEDTPLAKVKLITPPTVFEDFRGSYVEIYNRDLYRAAGIDQDFLQDDVSTSTRHVLRGLHGDDRTWKLISCLHGKFYLVVLDLDAESPTCGQWTNVTLSESNRRQVLIPPRHANGHLVLSDVALFHYKQTTQYDRASQFTVMWDDPRYKIFWPVATPILSPRDRGVRNA
jgi:dTDP-4-dehydrorhamnose 3,5-epimerase